MAAATPEPATMEPEAPQRTEPAMREAPRMRATPMRPADDLVINPYRQ